MTAPPERPAVDKTELIERSLRVFHFGVPGVVPFLGIPFAWIAIANNARIRSAPRPPWNPAQAYLFWGIMCARVGVSLTIVLAALLLATMILELLG